MISLQQVSYRYKGATGFALDNVSLTVEDGDFVGIVGNSGTGKSTLTYVMNGIVPHYYRGDFYGAVLIDGRDTVDMGLLEISRLVGSVCQDIDSQMVASVVEDEVLYALENFGFSRDEIERRLESALAGIGISDLRYAKIASLSGGQKQKVAIAAILALEPSYLVLDEPTAELDPASSRQVYELLKHLSDEQGITVIVVEQKLKLLCEYAKHIVAVDGGRIACSGTVNEVLCENDALESIGIAVPPLAALSKRLGEAGIADGRICRTVDEAAALVGEVL